MNGEKTHSEKPVMQAKDPQPGVSPISGTAPPKAHRWKPGQSGNPKGRPNAGASVREYFNEMGELTVEDIQRIHNDPKSPANKVTAAQTWLDALTTGDMADFEDVFRLDKSLEQLRAEGIDTSCIKQFVRRVSPDGIVTHTISLKDAADKAIDRILDRTNGRPPQAVQVDTPNPVGVRVHIITREEMDQVEVVESPPPELGE